MDKHTHTSIILVEIQKAFDILYHGVLERMKYFSSQLCVIEWFESYLSNRNFWFVLIFIFNLRLEH